MRTTSIVGVMVMALLVGAPAHAGLTPGGNEFDSSKDRETLLLTPSLSGGFPNGPSRNAAFSGDRQLATKIAFESDASDIARGDTNRTTDVFVITRRKPYDLTGPPWRAAATALVSRGLGGRPANGPSSRPDVDGDQRSAPRCVAFVSKASDLVRGDTNGRSDAFVADLRTGAIRRVSVASDGRQANGDTTEVQIDGECGRVAFTSTATNLALTSTSKPLWKSAVTARPKPGSRQVYIHVLDGARDNAGLDGLTFLASAGPGGRAANGESFDPSLARGGGGTTSRRGDFHGEALAFTSLASNLGARDRNGVTDVYVRTFERGTGGLRFGTRLASATRSGGAGNSTSSSPDINDRGDYVAYVTTSWDILANPTNWVPAPAAKTSIAQIARAHLTRGAIGQEWVSLSERIGQPGFSASADPVITRPGSPIFFASDAANLNYVAADRNEIRDIFFWNVVSRNATVQSRASDQRLLGVPEGFKGGVPAPGAQPTENPATSYYGNYIAFESGNPLVDRRVAAREAPDLLDDEYKAATVSRAHPEWHQIYLRYIGPA